MIDETSSPSANRITSRMGMPYNRSSTSASLGEISEVSSSTMNTPFTSPGQGLTPMETLGGPDMNMGSSMGFGVGGNGVGISGRGDRGGSQWPEPFGNYSNEDIDISSYGMFSRVLYT
jgi:hypothetical protein